MSGAETTNVYPPETCVLDFLGDYEHRAHEEILACNAATADHSGTCGVEARNDDIGATVRINPGKVCVRAGIQRAENYRSYHTS